MKAITPNYVNELADMIAIALERAFPETLFVIQPQVAYGARLNMGTLEPGIQFIIRALLSEEERLRDPQMVQQVGRGQIRRILLLKPEGQPNLRQLVNDMIPGLIDDLNHTILNPLT